MSALRKYLTRPRKHTSRQTNQQHTPTRRNTPHVHTPPPLSLTIR
jgi:hypothetical protein